MKFLKTFKDKVIELEKAKQFISDTEKKLNDEATEIQNGILDLINEIGLNKINIDVNVNKKYIYEICCKYDSKSDLKDVLILWRNTDISQEMIYQNTLWYFNAGGKSYYLELAEILKYLIDTYPEEYKKVKMKKDSEKFNI